MDVTLSGTGFPTGPAVAGVADTRATRLDRLAESGARAAADSLRHVIPAVEAGQVAVAAFASSI